MGLYLQRVEHILVININLSIFKVFFLNNPIIITPDPILHLFYIFYDHFYFLRTIIILTTYKYFNC